MSRREEVDPEIQVRMIATSQALGEAAREFFESNVGFVVMAFRFDGPEMSYVSNAARGDMVKALREFADTLEAHGDYPNPGHERDYPE